MVRIKTTGQELRFYEHKKTADTTEETYTMYCVDCIPKWEQKDAKCKRWTWIIITIILVILAVIVTLNLSGS